MKSRKNNLKDLHFGKWTVLEFSHINSSRSAYWKCKCECGNEHIIAALNLRKGKSTQCRSCAAKQKTAIYNSSNTKEFLYIFYLEGYYKIGVTNNVTKRLIQIDKNSPFPCYLISVYKNRPGLEKEIHENLKLKCIRGEWFNLNQKDLEWVQQLACVSGVCEI